MGTTSSGGESNEDVYDDDDERGVLLELEAVVYRNHYGKFGSIAIQHLPSLSVRGSGGLKWMLKQRSGLMPSSRIRFLSTSSGGLIFSNAILTLRTMGPCSMFCGRMRKSTSLCVI